MNAIIRCHRYLDQSDGIHYHLSFNIGLIQMTLDLTEAQVLGFIGLFFGSEHTALEISVFSFSSAFIKTPDKLTMLTKEMVGIK